MEKKIINYLDVFLYWSLVFFPFSIAIAPAFTGICLGTMLFSFFAKKILNRDKSFPTTQIDIAYTVFAIVSIISIINSIDYKASMDGIRKLAQNALIYLILTGEIKDRQHVKRIIIAMLAGGFLASFDAIWQIIFGKDFIRGHLPIINIGLMRATAAFPNANVLGTYLSPIAPVAFGFALYYLKSKKRLLAFVLGIAILIGIFLTFSRPAALAFYISLLFLGIVKKDKVVIAALLVFLMIVPFIAPGNIKDWAREINYNPVVFMCNTDRISIYRNTLNMIKHHPIIGVGLNTFSKNYFFYKLPEPQDAKTGDTMYAHNNFLHITGEVGILGLLAFIWLLYRLFYYCAFIYKRLNDRFLKSLSLFLTASLIAFQINGLTETNLYYSRVAVIFWYIVGFALSFKKFASPETQR